VPVPWQPPVTLQQPPPHSGAQPQDKNLNLRLKMPSCCMLDPPYILNLTNIYLQVNYCLVKQRVLFLITRTETQQEDRNHIISEKKTTHNLKFAPTITYC